MLLFTYTSNFFLARSLKCVWKCAFALPLRLKECSDWNCDLYSFCQKERTSIDRISLSTLIQHFLSVQGRGRSVLMQRVITDHTELGSFGWGLTRPARFCSRLLALASSTSALLVSTASSS
jgi:hypothetical protein